MLKLIFVLAFVAVTSTGFAPAVQVFRSADTPVLSYATSYALRKNIVNADDDFDPHPQYKYAYGVEDKLTGDSKSQVEERNGDVVRGEYSLIDADGFKRTVKYSADDVNGFNAVVEREALVKSDGVAPINTAPVAVKSLAPHASVQGLVKNLPSVSAALKSVASVLTYSRAPFSHITTPFVRYAVPNSNFKTLPPMAYSAPIARSYSGVDTHDNVPTNHYAAGATLLKSTFLDYAPSANYVSYVAPGFSYNH